MEDDKKIKIDNIPNTEETQNLGLPREGSFGFQRRSSMKHHRSSIKGNQSETNSGRTSEVKFSPDKTFKRKITWKSDENEGEAKTPDTKYRDSKTFYSDKVDRENDLYLQKLDEINKIETTVILLFLLFLLFSYFHIFFFDVFLFNLF